MWIAFQQPGVVIRSPSTAKGASHLVVSFGTFMVHTAWNSRVLPSAFAFALQRYRARAAITYNEVASTRNVIPCMRIQRLGYALGIEDECASEELTASMAQKQGHTVKNFAHEPASLEYCTDCELLIDLFAIDKRCVPCFRQTLEREESVVVVD